MTADISIPRGASMKLDRVEGRLDVGSGATIRAAQGNLVLVTGQVRFRGSATLECNFECGELTVERAGKLVVHGDLTVHTNLDVSNAIDVTGAIKAEGVDVGGRVNARSVTCKGMRVGGIATVSESLEASLVDVGGKLEARGTVTAEGIQVGGRAEIGGGVVKGIINVGGKFESSSRLDFGELQVFGMCSLAGGSKGRKITGLGRLESHGDLECDEVNITGIASISGDCTAKQVEISGKLDVKGSLSATERLEVSGATGIGMTLAGQDLSARGTLSAERAIFSKVADISGRLETKVGLKATSVLIRGGTSCKGPLVGETVEVGASGPGVSAFFWGQRLRIQSRTSKVEDIYASKVVIGPDSRAGRIFAGTAVLESGCDVDKVSYTSELKVAGHVKIAYPVQKVDKLEEPPL